jgi:hypothetical protein
MNLLQKISCSFLSKDTDYRFARSLKKVKEADLLAANIDQRLFEIQKSQKAKSIKIS